MMTAVGMPLQQLVVPVEIMLSPAPYGIASTTNGAFAFNRSINFRAPS